MPGGKPRLDRRTSLCEPCRRGHATRYVCYRGTANLGNEPAVDREGHDANGGKHRFKIALPNQLLRTFQQKKLYAHGIAIAGNVENAALAGSGNFQFPKPAWPPDPPPPNAFYNIDGKRIVALGHMEFHGWEHHMRALKTDTISCWYNVDTFNISEDAAIISRAPNRRRIISSAFLTNIRWIRGLKVTAWTPTSLRLASGITMR